MELLRSTINIYRSCFTSLPHTVGAVDFWHHRHRTFVREIRVYYLYNIKHALLIKVLWVCSGGGPTPTPSFIVSHVIGFHSNSMLIALCSHCLLVQHIVDVLNQT